MPVNYNVQAQVIDIQNDSPGPTDSFLVDSNVWFWITYPKGGGYTPSRTRLYVNFVSKSLRARAKLHCCELSLAELAHIIERAERDIYNTANGANLGSKEFRHNYPAERGTVVAEIGRAWQQVTTMASSLSATVDASTVAAALVAFQTQRVDGYDLFVLQAAAMRKIVQVLTDDGDYCTVPGLQVFTANSTAIQAASAQGKLLVR